MTIQPASQPKSPLRQRMIEDMAMRSRRHDTQGDYLRFARGFAGFLKRSRETGHRIRVMTRDDLGLRICVMRPSNSGKATLATAIRRAHGLTPIHLDRLYHIPNTDWRPRTDEQFIALHDEALSAASWVIDGNYSGCLPQRLARATGLILLDTSTATSLLRYLRRSRLERDRPDGLEGAWIASSGR